MKPNQIKQIRAALDLTQRKFGERLGVSVVTVVNWEKGTKHPRPKNVVAIQRLAEEVNVTVPKNDVDLKSVSMEKLLNEIKSRGFAITITA